MCVNTCIIQDLITSVLHVKRIHARTKHIEIDYHLIREQVLANKLVLRYIASHAQLADIFTKGLSVSRFNLLKSKLMVGPPPMSLTGGVN